MTSPTENQKLLDWVAHWAEIFDPTDIHWCDGTAEEADRLASLLVESGTFERPDRKSVV